MCLCVVVSDSISSQCNFILGSVCHGSGRQRLFGSFDLSFNLERTHSHGRSY